MRGWKNAIQIIHKCFSFSFLLAKLSCRRQVITNGVFYKGTIVE